MNAVPTGQPNDSLNEKEAKRMSDIIVHLDNNVTTCWLVGKILHQNLGFVWCHCFHPRFGCRASTLCHYGEVDRKVLARRAG